MFLRFPVFNVLKTKTKDLINNVLRLRMIGLGQTGLNAVLALPLSIYAPLPLAALSWRFRDSSTSTWLPAQVPGCVHTDLLRANKIPDPFWGTNEATLQWIEERDWEYRAEFTVSSELLSEETVELVAEGLDTVATVFLNGKEIAQTENMFVGYRWTVAKALVTGKNEIRIVFTSAMTYIRNHRRSHAPKEINDPVGRCTVIRKQQCQFGWDWGPRFVTAGIWRDLRLEAWSANRLESLQVTQKHATTGSVTLSLAPELARRDRTAICRWRLSLDQTLVAEGTGPQITVKDPQLWWPRGQGAQPLYHLEVDVVAGDGNVIGSWRQKIGLRTLALDRHRDTWGQSFQFVVNGRAIFAKGANWIPVHSFVANLTREDYARDLRSAADAHMNMVRVWGGGIYESEDFYDLCDELGLLVWQDFMFSCTPYPGDRAFISSIETEAIYQIQPASSSRLPRTLEWKQRSLELQCPRPHQAQIKSLRTAYEKVFHKTLPRIVADHDGVVPYWPSSPWRGDPSADHASGEKRGDTHYWDVWHARHPVKDYEKWNFRFVSEFGMQSYSSPATNATFCAPDGDSNVFGPTMENHQKNRAGNQIILDYVSTPLSLSRPAKML